MTKNQLTKQRDDLFDAVESLLRMTAEPDPTHPTWASTRAKAAKLWQQKFNER